MRARAHAVVRFSEREFEDAWERGGWARWKAADGSGKRE